MSLLHIREIRKSFGANQAVKGISFDLEAGEMLAMIGPNGAASQRLSICSMVKFGLIGVRSYSRAAP